MNDTAAVLLASGLVATVALLAHANDRERLAIGGAATRLRTEEAPEGTDEAVALEYEIESLRSIEEATTEALDDLQNRMREAGVLRGGGDGVGATGAGGRTYSMPGPDGEDSEQAVKDAWSQRASLQSDRKQIRARIADLEAELKQLRKPKAAPEPVHNPWANVPIAGAVTREQRRAGLAAHAENVSRGRPPESPPPVPRVSAEPVTQPVTQSVTQSAAPPNLPLPAPIGRLEPGPSRLAASVERRKVELAALGRSYAVQRGYGEPPRTDWAAYGALVSEHAINRGQDVGPPGDPGDPGRRQPAARRPSGSLTPPRPVPRSPARSVRGLPVIGRGQGAGAYLYAPAPRARAAARRAPEPTRNMKAAKVPARRAPARPLERPRSVHYHRTITGGWRASVYQDGAVMAVATARTREEAAARALAQHHRARGGSVRG